MSENQYILRKPVIIKKTPAMIFTQNIHTSNRQILKIQDFPNIVLEVPPEEFDSLLVEFDEITLRQQIREILDDVAISDSYGYATDKYLDDNTDAILVLISGENQ